MKVKIEIEVTDKEFETANFILNSAIKSLESSQETRNRFGVSLDDLNKAEVFRKKVIDSFVDNDALLKKVTGELKS